MSKRDLLHMPLIGTFIRSRWYPGVFQYALLFLFALVLLWAFFGTVRASKNIATLVIWGLWWTLLPFAFLLFGRIWCGVCPLAKTGDLIQMCFKGHRRFPGAFLRRYGIWIMISLFVLLTWVDRISSFAGSPRATGILLLLLLAGAVIIMFFYKRRTWCRYLCPIGGLSGIYSMASFTELRSQSETCQNECGEKACMASGDSAQSCPLFEHPPIIESNRNCNFCLNCLRSCQHNALSWRLRTPTKELSQLRQRIPAEAFLALIMVILVYFQTVSMSKLFPRYMKWVIEGSFIQNYHAAFTMTFAALLVVGFFFYGLASYVASLYSKEPLRQNFASFGYALIPLGLAGHLAHNMFHLIKEGKEAVQTILVESGILIGIVKASAVPRQEIPGQAPFIQAVQMGIILVGILGSLVVLIRSNRVCGGNPHFRWSRILPHMIMVAIIGVVFLHLFLLPMNLRHFH